MQELLEFTSMLESSAAPMALCRPDGSYVSATPAYSELVGWPVDALLGGTVATVTHRADLQDTLALARELASGRQGWGQTTKRYVRVDGDIVWANVYVAALCNDVDGTFGLLAHAQPALSPLTSPNGGHNLDHVLATGAEEVVFYRLRLLPDLAFEHLSRSAEAMSGYTVDHLIAEPRAIFDIIHPDDADVLTAHLTDPVEAARQQILRWIRPDGTEVVTKARSTPVFEDGRLAALEGVLVDVTRWRDAERARTASDARWQSLVRTQATGALLGTAPSKGRPHRRRRIRGIDAAAGRGELVTHFQPIVDLGTGRPVAAEALIRWNHPRHGLIPPSEFIPAAEESGAITSLGAWILDDACRQLAGWRTTPGLEDFTVSVNLSASQLHDASVVDLVSHTLASHRLPSEALTLEVTESAALGHGHLDVLRAIDALGVTLALDDFGTHYSSLSYLQRLPVRHLKIDRSFVADILHDRQSRAIVTSLVHLAHGLDLVTVAEGVEDASTANDLRLIGIDRGQGFFFARPMPAGELTTLLDDAVSQ